LVGKENTFPRQGGELDTFSQAIIANCLPREGRSQLPCGFLFRKLEPFDQDLQLAIIIPTMVEELFENELRALLNWVAHLNEGLGPKVLNILFRRRGGVLSSLLGLSKPGHALHANKLEPPGAHEGKGDLPSARVHLRIIRSRKKRQMTVPLLLMLSNRASELPHQGAVTSLHLPIGLGVVGRGIARGYIWRERLQ